jgi:hypothetical protein
MSRPSAAAVKLQVEASLAHKIPSALTVQPRSAPELMATGIREIDEAIGGGIPRGGLTEICGHASSGRMSVLLSLLARTTARKEAVAVVDASDAFHPESAEIAGVELRRVLWIRCQPSAISHQPSEKPLPQSAQRDAKEKPRSLESALRAPLGMTTRKERLKPVEQALKATDLLLQSGGFGLIVVDLGDIRAEDARRVPLTTWFRFRRAIENTPTTLVVIEQEPYAKTCASLVMELRAAKPQLSAVSDQPSTNLAIWRSGDRMIGKPPSHAHLLKGMNISVQLSRGQVVGRKPPASVPVFESRTELAAIG